MLTNFGRAYLSCLYKQVLNTKRYRVVPARYMKVVKISASPGPAQGNRVL